MSDDNEKYTIKAVERSFEILDFCARTAEPLTAQAVCREFGLNANMAFRMLATMAKTGYLEKDEKTGVFSISLKFLPLSRKALMSLEIRRTVMPFLEMLRQRYPNANLNLGVLYQGDVIVIDRIDSMSLPRTYFAPGKSLPFHATGMGKSLSCELPEEELDLLIEKKGLKAYTPSTITSPEALKEELAKVRREHASRDRSEFIPSDNCNAVPLRDASETIIAAISLSAFESYMTVEELEATMPVLAETGRNISYYMGYNA
ncbi:MAG TPA: IclR family transcriptional regulator [Rectinemataceae bacterium]|nr:IclR family transcriptional regulator [Rectinemataceae bacterium]